MASIRWQAVAIAAAVAMAGVAGGGAAQQGAAPIRDTSGNAPQAKLRAYVQADGRFFPGGTAALGTSNLFIRRARLTADITARRYFVLRLSPDFGQGKLALFDGYLDVKVSPQFTARAGKAKPPVGLERLQAATDIRFVERGLTANLLPNRDIGLQAFGDLGKGVVLTYAVGVFDGVPDAGNGDGDLTNDKDVVARVFARLPKGAGVGIAVTTGSEHGTVSASALPTYVTTGQQTMFRFRDSTVADGRRFRVTPQAYGYVGPVGLLGEYVVSAQDVTRGTTVGRRLTHHGWQVAGSWFLTGEKASYTTVTPRRPFDPRARSWGAVELAARYSELAVDDGAFPTFATATTSVSRAKAWGLGVTWHLGPALKVAVNYEETSFTGGAAAGNRASEHFVATRVQQAF